MATKWHAVRSKFRFHAVKSVLFNESADCPRRLFDILAWIAMALLCSIAPDCMAGPVSVIATSELRFGQFAVVSAGSRTVSASGIVTDNGVFPLRGGVTSPATFSVAFTRPPLSLQSTTLLQLQLSSGPIIANGMVTAKISQFDTDLPGGGSFSPGSLVSVTLPPCLSAQCTQNFKVGGRLEITRSNGGASLRIPVVATVTIVSAF